LKTNALKHNPDAESRANLKWLNLASEVRSFGPDVVVLVARKMPRIQDLLRLDFGVDVLIVSDYAIPFLSATIIGSRVAIIDDVVNVGSTLSHALQAISKYRPKAIELFALSSSGNSKKLDIDVRYTWKTQFSDSEYRDHVSEIPHLVSDVPKPFDLVFPIFQTNVAVSSAEVAEEFVSGYARDRFEILPTPYHNSPVSRATIFLERISTNQIRKIRVYRDVVNDSLCFSFMAISAGAIDLRPTFETRPAADLYKEIIGKLEVSGNPPEKTALAHAVIFCRSLDFGLSEIKANRVLTDLVEEDSLSLDMHSFRYLFGYESSVNLSQEFKAEGSDSLLNSTFTAKSPFMEHFDLGRLLSLMEHDIQKKFRSDRYFDISFAFSSLFRNLAILVGASDPESYSLSWPFSAEEIRKNPYLRLEIGPTFSDIVDILSLVASNCQFDESVLSARSVSKILDISVDSGMVVPTFSTMNSSDIFRIYRRGEKGEARDKLTNVVALALDTLEREVDGGEKFSISRTRLSKLCAVLGYAEKYEYLVGHRNETRGVTATAPRALLDNQRPEVVKYLSGRSVLIDEE